MEILVVCGAAGLIAAALGSGRGRSPVAWFLYGFFLPPVAVLHGLFLAPPAVCDACRERIQPDARTCPHCGSVQPAKRQVVDQ